MLFLFFHVVLITIFLASTLLAQSPNHSPEHSHNSSDFDWKTFLNDDLFSEVADKTSSTLSSMIENNDEPANNNLEPYSRGKKLKTADLRAYKKTWMENQRKKIKTLPQDVQNAIKEQKNMNAKNRRAKYKKEFGYTSVTTAHYSKLRELVRSGKATLEQQEQVSELREKDTMRRKKNRAIQKAKGITPSSAGTKVRELVRSGKATIEQQEQVRELREKDKMRRKKIRDIHRAKENASSLAKTP